MDAEPVIPLEQSGAIAGELLQLWLTLAPQRWSALLLLPAPGVESALPIANGLVQVSRRAGLETRCSLVDGTRISLERAAGVATSITARVAQGDRVVVPVDGLEESAAGMTLASRCDAALLCVALGKSDLRSARRTLERCGRARFLGTAVIVPRKATP